MKLHKGHPLQIFSNIYGLLFLLLIPLARGLFLTFTGGFIAWIEGSWFDILVLVGILTVGILNYNMTTFSFSENRIILNKGMLFRRTKIISCSNILTALLTHPYYLRPFGAAVLRLDTIGGNGRKSDFNLILHKEVAQAVIKDVKGEVFQNEISYKSNPLYILAFSLISSNSFAGIVIITTAITQLGKIVGTQISNEIVGRFQTISRALAFGIPPAAATFAYLVFFGWLVAFSANVVRHKNLEVHRNGRTLKIKSGIFTKREYTIKPTSISYLDIKQTVATKILGLYTASIYAIGYGKEKNGIHVIIPAANKKTLPPLLDKLLPDLIVSKRQIKPNFGAVMRFVIDPMYPCVLTPLIILLLILIYPEWSQLLFFIALIVLIPSIWFLAIRLIDFSTSGLSYDMGCFTLRYSSGFYLHTVVFNKSKLVGVRIRQSIIQRFSNKCDVFISTCTEGKSRHRLRNLSRDVVEDFFRENI